MRGTFTCEVSKVSIHAPTRGATAVPRLRFVRFRGFNPRTHEGCDQFNLVTPLLPASFNPRTHEGCDCLRATFEPLAKVSIHAPTRGATDVYAQVVSYYMFQSTHPRGVRPLAYITISQLKSFNPRTHEGCDNYLPF
mgnify:CR=1 FL=1